MTSRGELTAPQGWATPAVAAAADGHDFQRFPVVPVIPIEGRRSAIDAYKRFRARQPSSSHLSTNGGVGGAHSGFVALPTEIASPRLWREVSGLETAALHTVKPDARHQAVT